IAACAFDAAISSRHNFLSKPMEALMRVISSSGLVSNRPPQVRCVGFSPATAGALPRRGGGVKRRCLTRLFHALIEIGAHTFLSLSALAGRPATPRSLE